MRPGLPPWPLWTLALAIAFALGGAIAGAAVVALIAWLGGLVAGVDVGIKSPGVTLASTLAQDAAMIGGSLLAVKIAAGNFRLRDFGLVPARRRLAAAGLVLLTWVAFLIITAVWTKFVGHGHRQSITKDLGADRSAILWVGTAFVVAYAAPLAEEFFFRGMMLTVLWRRVGFGGAALITGALFGLVHSGSSDPALLVPLAVLGILLCVLKRLTASLVPCVAAHALNNSVAFGLLEHASPLGFVGLVAFGVIGAGGTAAVISRRS